MLEVQVDQWKLRELDLTWPKVKFLWEMLSRHKTLFSDYNRGHFEPWLNGILQYGSFWCEVLSEDEEIVGLICFDGLDGSVECEARFIFFDRKPAEKLGVLKEGIKFVFENFPIQRICVTIPEIYFATSRVVEKLGFTKEGSKREATLMDGNWINVAVYGLLRREL